MKNYKGFGFRFINGVLYMESETEIDESISDEMDFALTQLNMYETLEPVEGNVKITYAEGPIEFTKDELIRFLKAFGTMIEKEKM